MSLILFIFMLISYSIQVSSRYYSRVSSREPISAKARIIFTKKNMVLGFFKPAPSFGSGVVERWYLGIWHRRFPKEVVWVANRDNPLSEPIGSLEILNGNLVLLGQYGTPLWSTNQPSTSLKRSLLIGELMENGNLVLRYANEDSSAGYLWQSFDFSTDTLISGMKLGWDAKSNINRVLQSWRNDPSSGDYTYGVERNELVQSFIRKKGVPEFRSDPWMTRNDVEEGSGKFTYERYKITVSPEEATYYFTISNDTFLSVLNLTVAGVLNRTTWIPKPHQRWKPIELILPDDACDDYEKCGENALCGRDTSRENCDCVPGFKPRDKEAWGLHDYAGGCERNARLNCYGDGFVRLETMKLPDASKSVVDRRIGLKECREKCLGNCKCTAYANADMQNGGSGCVIWVGDLLGLMFLPYLLKVCLPPQGFPFI